MKVLTNFGVQSRLLVEDFHNDYQELGNFLAGEGLDGVEIILYGDFEIDKIDKDIIKGLHLSYWPAWIDFWRGNLPVLKRDFIDKKSISLYYCMDEPAQMVDWFRREAALAAKLEAEYMVYHVSQVALPEVFSHRYLYSDQEVLDIAAEFINIAFCGPGPALLFENLSWPGLTLLNKDLLCEFMAKINYPDKGVMLDTGHLLCTAPHLKDEDEAIQYIHQVLDDLGGAGKFIRGIHLNRSHIGIPEIGALEEESQKLLALPSLLARLEKIHEYIGATDKHLPFLHPGVKEIIRRIEPEWLVYEINTGAKEDLRKKLKAQHTVLGRSV